MEPLLIESPDGLYCPAGDFHVDADRGVPFNVITHAHADHARWGSTRYLCSREGEPILRERMAKDATIDSLPYGESFERNGVRVGLHPAGHVRGSAQVRIEHKGRVLVCTGDYKRQADPTCTPFEVVRCDEFITESTFGLPIYRWKDPAEIAAEINAWWRGNVAAGRTSVILAYTLGKSQRILSMLDASIGPVLLHGSMVPMTQVYRDAGVALPPAEHATKENAKANRGRAMVIAPPSAHGSTWMRKFLPASVASASGWMTVRGQRRRRAVDRGFVVSDHVDWPGLLETIRETGATRVGVTHGYTSVVTRYLQSRGLDAYTIHTRFVGDGDDGGDVPPTNATVGEAGPVSPIPGGQGEGEGVEARSTEATHGRAEHVDVSDSLDRNDDIHRTTPSPQPSPPGTGARGTE